MSCFFIVGVFCLCINSSTCTRERKRSLEHVLFHVLLNPCISSKNFKSFSALILCSVLRSISYNRSDLYFQLEWPPPCFMSNPDILLQFWGFPALYLYLKPLRIVETFHFVEIQSIYCLYLRLAWNFLIKMWQFLIKDSLEFLYTLIHKVSNIYACISSDC